MGFQVVNKKSFSGQGEFIGRPSVLGNPFHVGRDGSREQVIGKYRQWLWQEIKQKGKVYNELIRLAIIEKNTSSLTLVCFCKPLACHGDVIVKAIEWLKLSSNHSLSEGG